jgi:hypothetical protein
MTDSPRPSKLLRGSHLSARYSRSSRTIKRWKDTGILPPPDLVINGVEYWHSKTIEQNERERLSTKPPDEAA